MLERVKAAFFEQIPDIQILTISGLSWGAGLNALAPQAIGDYWLTCCDDTIPWPGWFEAARSIVDGGKQPAVRYFEQNGEPNNSEFDLAEHGALLTWSRCYLLTPQIFETVGPFIDASWWVDNDYSERLIAAGFEIVACDGFCFTHLNGDHDWASSEEVARSRKAYEESSQRRAG